MSLKYFLPVWNSYEKEGRISLKFILIFEGIEWDNSVVKLRILVYREGLN